MKLPNSRFCPYSHDYGSYFNRSINEEKTNPDITVEILDTSNLLVDPTI